MNGLNSPEDSEITLFRRYYMAIPDLRKRLPDSGSEKALSKAGIHQSWTNEALDKNPNKYSWVKLVDEATQLVTDPNVNSDLRDRIKDGLNDLEVFSDLGKPITALENKSRLQRLLQLVQRGK